MDRSGADRTSTNVFRELVWEVELQDLALHVGDITVMVRTWYGCDGLNNAARAKNYPTPSVQKLKVFTICCVKRDYQLRPQEKD